MMNDALDRHSLPSRSQFVTDIMKYLMTQHLSQLPTLIYVGRRDNKKYTRRMLREKIIDAKEKLYMLFREDD